MSIKLPRCQERPLKRTQDALGLALSVDLIFQGCALIGLGLRLRAAG
jgi:hypothetical protein